MRYVLILLVCGLCVGALIYGGVLYLHNMTPAAVYSRQQAAEVRAQAEFEEAKAQAELKRLEALKDIETLKNERQQAAIAYRERQTLVNTPLVKIIRQVSAAWVESLPLSLPGLVLVVGAVVVLTLTRWRPVEYRTGETSTTIPMCKASYYVQQALDIERLRATEGRAVYDAIEQATNHRLSLFAQSVRPLKGLVSPHNSLPQQAPPALPVQIPAFREIVNALDPGDEMYLGTDIASQEAVTGTFDDLYSSFFAGESGSGKSSWLRGIMAQSLICTPGVIFHILDPHSNRPDSLSASLPRGDAFVFLDRTDPTPGIYAVNRLLQGRLDAPVDSAFPPLVFVCDELNYCSKQKYALTLQTLFDRIATEGRKVGVYLLVSSQDTRMKKGLDFRDTLASSYVFRMKPRQASYLLQDSDETAKHKQVKEKGQALLNLTSGESTIVKVPFCSPADLREFGRDFLKVANGDPVVSAGNVAATHKPVASTVAAHVTGDVAGLSLAKKVTAYMQDHDVTLSKFADRCGINKGTLSKFMSTGKLSEDMTLKLEAFIMPTADPESHDPEQRVIDLATRKHDRGHQ
jgi:hypothetical protein